ncbi:MAG: glycosyl hydrolase [Anaerolineae bacterium]
MIKRFGIAVLFLCTTLACSLSGGVLQEATPSPASMPSPTAPEQVLLTVDTAPTGVLIRPLLGVNGGPLPADRGSGNPALTEQYRTIGVTMIRTHDLGGPLDMAIMYPDQSADPHDPASYDFAASDRVFAAIVEGGFEPYLRLGDSWAVRGLERRAPVNPDNWTQAAVEVVRHYDEISRQAGIPLRYVEIWNEPNFEQFWDATPREFYELFARTAVALKAEFPHLMVGGPGLVSPGDSLTPEGEPYTQHFLDYLQQQDTPLDFLSWHVYSSNAATYAQLAAFYRQQLDAHGYTGAESHITEWNTAMQGEDETDEVRNTARSASLMTAAWIALQEEGVAASTFYRGNELSGNMGLFYPDGRAKPIALAFSLWAEMAAHPQRLGVTAADGGSATGSGQALWALAGQDERGEVALLIANPTDTAISWQARLAGHDLAGGATLHQVSPAGDEMQTLALETPAAEIGAYTVQLVIVNP